MVMKITAKANRLRGLLISSAGIIILSFDTALIRLASSPSWKTAFWRGTLIAVITSLLLFFREKTTVADKIRKEGMPLVFSGIMWGLSGVLFVISVKLTVAANVLVMLSLSPLFAGILGYFLLGERLKKITYFTMTVSAAGVYIIFAGDIEGGNIAGNILGFLVPVFLGGNLVWMRKHKEISRSAAVVIGGLVTAIIAFYFAFPFNVSFVSFIYLALLGLVAIPMGQLLISTGTRFIPAAEVALIVMLESVIGPFWVWVLIGEIPPVRTFLGGMLILSGVFLNSVFSFNKVKE